MSCTPKESGGADYFKEPEMCRWAHEWSEDGYLPDDQDERDFITECGETFSFSSDGPEENKFRHCPYCGKPLEVEDEG